MTSQFLENARKHVAKRYVARVHNISSTSYGLRWALDLETDDGTKWLKKYSHFKKTEGGWAEFRDEMARIGITIPVDADRNKVFETVKGALMGKPLLIEVRFLGYLINVVFVRRIPESHPSSLDQQVQDPMPNLAQEPQ